ncbi:HK97 family phage prohead protease [Enterococcus gallinarum]|uniref:HK97 family phage prohead protease n=1 Tax=Enterococcus gallinarum TaxID=1353 RepID=UPI001EEF2B31|nr:HK97 family phage prohead protease [Enterococcus gallinarum]
MENDTEVIEGYALKFDRWSDTLGWFYPFREKLEPGCLDDADTNNVVALFNHDQSQILGRTGVNLDLNVDNIGLKFRIKPTNTTLSNDLIENIRSGVINQCSFAFTIPDEEGAEEWRENKETGVYERYVRKIDKLYDVSVVTTPAYPDTEAVVGARSKEIVEELRSHPKKQEIQRMLAELDKEEILNTL